MKTLRLEFYLLAVIMVAWLPSASLWAKDSTETISASKEEYLAYLSEQKAELAQFQSLSQSELKHGETITRTGLKPLRRKLPDSGAITVAHQTRPGSNTETMLGREALWILKTE